MTAARATQATAHVAAPNSGPTGGDNGGTPTAPDPGDQPTPGDPVKKVTDTAKDTAQSTQDTVTNTVSALDKAKATCQSTFTDEQIAALGGLTACANAVLDKGVKAVADSLLGGATGGLLP